MNQKVLLLENKKILNNINPCYQFGFLSLKLLRQGCFHLENMAEGFKESSGKIKQLQFLS